ncbi:hypothetical protein Cgig2_010565 [Carnegiea gigantea]|uniref:RRM domain-containing protein n=1 Tax=Carnegiea gigantea TaxID=171969 RepID=A0A9Q1QMY9_9CARY|nr:hypothetical protein Cgig2_010565 [Carnegiea gigantea]
MLIVVFLKFGVHEFFREGEMRPIFCGNFEFDARSSDLERLFRRYGKVDRVDMKSGFAFVYMEDERDAEYAIRALDRTEFGRKGRRLRVEWTKVTSKMPQSGHTFCSFLLFAYLLRCQNVLQHERGGRKPVSSRRSANLKPSKTLFVINFPYHTKTRDLERHFDPYGKIVNVRIRRNFAFVQYESQEDATKALDATNMSKMLDRVISVEYAAREDADKRGDYSPDRRGRDRSPDRRRRSPSPYRRERGSPDYGTGSSPGAYRRERGSPEYGHGSSRSPRRVERSSPDYDRARTTPSPRREEKAFPDYHRDRSQSRSRSRSRSRSGGERNGNGYSQPLSRSPFRREEVSPDHVHRPRSPVNNPEPKEDGEYESPVDDRYRSRTPPARERSQS